MVAGICAFYQYFEPPRSGTYACKYRAFKAMFIATGKDTLGIVFDLMGRLCGWHGWNTVVVLGKKPIAGIGIMNYTPPNSDELG